jgi:hypothetical protein
MWTEVDADNPPAWCMVAIYSDGSGAQILSRFDGDENYYLPEDGFAIDPPHVEESFSMWTPAPEECRPHFMEVTQDDWQ